MSSDADGPYADIVRDVWGRHSGLATARAELLAAVVGARARGEHVTPEDLASAREAAHQLAGSLAMYGLGACAGLAARLQRALDGPQRPRAWRGLAATAVRLRDVLATTTDD